LLEIVLTAQYNLHMWILEKLFMKFCLTNGTTVGRLPIHDLSPGL
jgi:hypothetical protein